MSYYSLSRTDATNPRALQHNLHQEKAVESLYATIPECRSHHSPPPDTPAVYHYAQVGLPTSMKTPEVEWSLPPVYSVLDSKVEPVNFDKNPAYEMSGPKHFGSSHPLGPEMGGTTGPEGNVETDENPAYGSSVPSVSKDFEACNPLKADWKAAGTGNFY